MKEEILNFIKKRGGGVSFVELENNIEGFRGSKFVLGGYKNLVLWAEVSKEAVDALGELVADNSIKAVGTNPIVYLVDGKNMSYPIAKKARDYKTARWMPTVFNIGQA